MVVALSLPTKPTRCAKGEGPLYAATLTSDGKYLLTGGQDRTVRLWNPHKTDPAAAAAPSKGTGRGSSATTAVPGALMIKAYPGGHGYDIRDIAVAADNSRLASVGGDRTPLLWDVTTGALRKLPPHDGAINACAANADFTVLFTGSYDRTVRAWDVRAHSRAPVQTLSEARDSVTAVLVTDGPVLLSASVDGCVRAYDARAGALRSDDVHEPVTSIATSRGDGGACMLASCLGSATLRLLERAGGAQLSAYRGHKNSTYPLGCAFSGDDAHVLSGSECGDIFAWDLVDSARPAARLRHHTRPVCAVAAHPSEPMLVSASHDGTAVVWE